MEWESFCKEKDVLQDVCFVALEELEGWEQGWTPERLSATLFHFSQLVPAEAKAQAILLPVCWTPHDIWIHQPSELCLAQLLGDAE